MVDLMAALKGCVITFSDLWLDLDKSNFLIAFSFLFSSADIHPNWDTTSSDTCTILDCNFSPAGDNVELSRTQSYS